MIENSELCVFRIDIGGYTDVFCDVLPESAWSLPVGWRVDLGIAIIVVKVMGGAGVVGICSCYNEQFGDCGFGCCDAICRGGFPEVGNEWLDMEGDEMLNRRGRQIGMRGMSSLTQVNDAQFGRRLPSLVEKCQAN
jgi:hypothetical protein